MTDFDIAAIFAHPDDAELVVGGTLAKEVGPRASGGHGGPDPRRERQPRHGRDARGGGRGGGPDPGRRPPRKPRVARFGPRGAARAARCGGRRASPAPAAGRRLPALGATASRPCLGQPHRLRRLLRRGLAELSARPRAGLPAVQARVRARHHGDGRDRAQLRGRRHAVLGNEDEGGPGLREPVHARGRRDGAACPSSASARTRSSPPAATGRGSASTSARRS